MDQTMTKIYDSKLYEYELPNKQLPDEVLDLWEDKVDVLVHFCIQSLPYLSEC